MAPSVTASQFRGLAYGSGAISLETAMSWLLILQVQESRLALPALAHGLRRKLPRAYAETSLDALDELAFGTEVPLYRTWMDELAPDSPWWRERDFSASVAGVTAPVQLTGGWYDIFLPWLLEDFRALREAGRSPQLIVGPWTHTSTELMAVSLREGLAWLRAHLLGDARMLREAAVRVFVTGEERWRDLPAWPPPGAGEHVLHLQPEGGLAEDPPPAGAAPSRYRYDPADPAPALGGPVLLERTPVRDNRALEARADVLTFTGKPLATDLDALGPVRADVRFRSTAPETDVFVRVCDVQPDGASLNVCDGLVRIGPGAPERDADGIAQVRFELWPTAHRFRAGHRIRVQVSSGAHPRYARSPTAAGQEVLHDAAHPSSLALTVL
jgi:putative CocE/NonD family hydrolase